MAKEVDLHISKRLQAVLPELTDRQKKQLAANLERDGEKLQTIPYWYDGKQNVILDGMHSWPIVKKLGIEYRTKEMTFANYEEAEDWIRKHQAGRRHSTPQQETILLGEEYNEEKRDDGGHGDQISGGQNVHPVGKTSENIAENRGVSPKTVERAGKFAENVAKLESALQVQVRAGKKVSPELLTRCVKLAAATQNELARKLRVGQATDVQDAMKQCGVPMATTAKAKPKAKPASKGDYGKCPNCAGTRWTEDQDGVTCTRCNHPHGEPAGEVDSDRANTQRLKTIKTVEALMRAFDDLQMLIGRPDHGEAIRTCKLLLRIAKAWK